MMRLFLILLSFLILATVSYAHENVFYILHSNTPAELLRNEKILQQLQPQAKKISTIISQAYRIDGNGNVSGFVDAQLINFARDKHIKLLALVTNLKFDAKVAHQFLSDKAAQKRAIETIVTACETYRYNGVQFDFEGVSINDKAALKQFYMDAAYALHKKKYLVSFAIVPALNDGHYLTEFQKRRYLNWAGVYDLKSLNKISDFITIMSYDQHQAGTPPGPIGGMSWVNATVKHALKYIAAKKLSLGIPVYSGYWVMNNPSSGKLTIRMAQISFKKVSELIKNYHLKLNWDAQDKVHYVFFPKDWLYAHLFVEDAKSFQEKNNLIKKYHLRGFSMFSLGNEDPAIWQYIKKAKQSS